MDPMTGAASSDTDDHTIPESRGLQLQTGDGEVLSEPRKPNEAEIQELADQVRSFGREWFRAGKILGRIKHLKNWKRNESSWNHYCVSEFGYTGTHANNMIVAARVYAKLTQMNCPVLPTREHQVRPLAGLLKKDRDNVCKVWLRAVELAKGKVPTNQNVKEARAEEINGSAPVKKSSARLPKEAQEALLRYCEKLKELANGADTGVRNALEALIEQIQLELRLKKANEVRSGDVADDEDEW